MTRRMSRSLLWTVVLLIGSAEPAHAKEPVQLDTGLCLADLRGAGWPAGGIATPGLTSPAHVLSCDGTAYAVESRAGGLALTPTNGAATAPRGGLAGGLPDGERTGGRGGIEAAWLAGPTEIYGHGILGDPVEASGFRVRRGDGSSFDMALEPGSVFEDLRVRLVDLTGDGRAEFVVVRSYLARGAALAVYGLTGTGIAPLAETPPIGQPYRWLNPAAAADFDGDGRTEIAYVETPHIGGILKLYELGDQGLTLEQSLPGFSNHAIGSRVLDMAAVLDWNGDGLPDLALPDDGRRRLVVAGFAGGRHQALASLPQPERIVTSILATDLDGDGVPELLFGLAGGTLVLAAP